ncbi:RNA exonuclease 1 [Thelohanellus kitauei]|uniref:RNA exonuclease 1 n=1 Tax=Thelohanellus kitauei TaxID=669202 RepID=A0A0C2MI78_THEKT|nr:RNA exonuclease 1 [Thelohanellus kitauei]
MELGRVTLLNCKYDIIYDKFVKPRNRIRDYNTKYSGIYEYNLIYCETRVEDVHKELAVIISHETILIGHAIENDLKALKIIHDKVIDTAIVFPHPKGFPYTLSLKQLANEILKINIQGFCYNLCQNQRAMTASRMLPHVYD